MKFSGGILSFFILFISCNSVEKKLLQRQFSKSDNARYKVQITQEFTENKNFRYQLDFVAGISPDLKNTNLLNCRYSDINISASGMGESAAYKTSSLTDTSGFRQEVLAGLRWIEEHSFTILLDSGNWISYSLDPLLLPDSLQGLSQVESTIEYLFIGTRALFPDLPRKIVSEDDSWTTDFFPVGEPDRKKSLRSDFHFTSGKNTTKLILEGKETDEGKKVQVGFDLSMRGEVDLDENGMITKANYTAKEEIFLMQASTGITCKISINKLNN